MAAITRTEKGQRVADAVNSMAGKPSFSEAKPTLATRERGEPGTIANRDYLAEPDGRLTLSLNLRDVRRTPPVDDTV